MSWMPLIELALAAGLPLMLVVTGELILQRSGMINIGLEGLMLAAALGAVIVSRMSGSSVAGMAGGITAALMLAALFGLMTIHARADQIVTGAAINFVAAGLTAFIYGRWKFELSSSITSFDLPVWALTLTWAAVPAIAAAFLYSTRAGLRLRACGDYPDAIALQGLSVARYRWTALLIEGVAAGLAGATFSLILASGFAENMTAGRGFIALAVVVLGRWRPLGAVAGAALFSLTIALQYALQAGSIKLQFHLLLALPYVVTLLVLTIVTTRIQAPRWLGREN